MDEDDFFRDDDLDDIPDYTLRALEQDAISSTQGPKKTTAQTHEQLKVQDTDTLHISRTSNQPKKVPWRPPQPIKRLQPSIQNVPSASVPQPPSSDYGFDDENVIDLDEPSMVIHPASTPQTATGAHLGPSATAERLYGSKTTLDPETEAAYAAADAELGGQQPGQWTRAASLRPTDAASLDVISLQQRIAELEAEQADLRRSEQEARDAASAKQGEIAILRSKQEKTSREYERRLSVMQRLHADESAKHKAELQVGRKEREKMETDNRFLQHDLAQEAEKAKRLTGPGVAHTAPSRQEKVTPRKASRTGLGDGFDDDEVQMVSPSKSKERPKDQTPKAGAKRKRPANDSPIPALSFSSPAPLVAEQSREQPSASGLGLTRALSQFDGDRLEFMQCLLNHSPYEGHDRSIEALTKHHVPSNPSKSLSALLMDLLMFSDAIKEDNMPLRLSRILLQLWSYCLDGMYYAALYLILDLLRFALCLELPSVKAQLIEEAIPICIRTIELITYPLVQASIDPAYANSLDREVQEKLSGEIDVEEILDFLFDLCSASTLSGDRIEAFWRNMELHSTLLMLNKVQPVNHIKTALRILATSALPTSFGAICDDEERQFKQENSIIDRLTSLLLDLPMAPNDEPAYTEAEIAQLRIEILNVLQIMCLTEHSSMKLSQHRSAIVLLILFLDGQVNRLYTVRPSLGLTLESDAEAAAHDLVTRTVNEAVRLVYHFVRNHEDAIDLNTKLHTIHGGYPNFLTCMTRIAFTEQLVFENGIDDEVVEAAHFILDSVLSPEAGEAVVRAVETPKSRKELIGSGETTEKNTSVDVTEVDGDTTMSGPG